MVQPPIKPIPERLKPLRAAFDRQPGVADDLCDLLDWSRDEVEALLNGEVEPEKEDMVIINGLMQHLQGAVSKSEPSSLAA